MSNSMSTLNLWVMSVDVTELLSEEIFHFRFFGLGVFASPDPYFAGRDTNTWFCLF